MKLILLFLMFVLIGCQDILPEVPIDDNNIDIIDDNDDDIIDDDDRDYSYVLDIEDYYDYEEKMVFFNHPYMNASTQFSIVFLNPVITVFSYQDTYHDPECFAINETTVIPCERYGKVNTEELGRHEVVYYVEDDEGLFRSVSFYKDVLTDKTLLDITLSEYYQSAQGLYGEELFNALRIILNSSATLQNYGAARTILQESDQDPMNPNHVIQLYTQNSVPATFHCPRHDDCNWNREHVWPIRRMPISRPSNTNTNMGSDLHNLAPEDYHENNYRAAKYFNETDSLNSYHPIDEVKGNVARILFYMDVMYSELTLVSGTPLDVNFEMGDLDFLLRWHFIDEVADFEYNRNEVIYYYQHNRNPFIDYPHFVELIWFNLIDYPYE